MSISPSIPSAFLDTGHPPVGAVGDQAARLRALIRSGGPPARATAVGGRTASTPAAPPAGRRARMISISSGKGGVGKTSLSVNLAVALAELGRRTVLVDADLGLANADVLCGMSPARRLDALLAEGARTLAEIAVDAPGGFRLVPGAVGADRVADLGPAGRGRLLEALSELERSADVVVVDTAAGLGRGVTSFMRAADLAVIVVTPEPTSIADAYALIKSAARDQGDMGATGGELVSPALVVNQARDAAEAQKVHARLDAVCAKFLGLRLELLGAVAHDPALPEAVRARRPVMLQAPRARCCRDCRDLALTLVRRLRPVGPVGAEKPAGLLARLVGGLFLRGS